MIDSEFWRSTQPGGYFDIGQWVFRPFREPELIVPSAWENGDSYCNINDDPSVPCAQGLVPYYVAQVQSVADVQTAVNFARDHSLSTRVKGASHDL